MKQGYLKQRKPDPPEERFPKEQEVARTPSKKGGSYRPLYYYYSYDNYYYKKNSRNNDSTENGLPSNSQKKKRKSNFKKSCLLTICGIISISFFVFLHVDSNHDEENYILYGANKHASKNYQSSSLLKSKNRQSDMKRSADDVSHHGISKEAKPGSKTSKQFPTKDESIDKSIPIKKTPTAANIPHNTNGNIEMKNDLPTFSKLPSPTSFCHPNSNNATNSKLNSYCNVTNCMQHKKEDLLLLDKSSEAAEQGSCKMLWFAAMHESKEECSESSIAKSKRHSYFVDYSVALNSALRNARDTLQPVLVLGRYGMPYENSTEPKKLGRWAEAKGVKVVYSPRLSFQKDVDQGLMKKGIIEYSKRQGTFLRLDIPKMIKEHGLLDLPNVCKDHVLYTDVDVIFANDITMRDIELLSKSVGQSIASYGREYSKSAQIFNAGVMVMNVERLDYEMPKIIEYAKSLDSYPSHDQEMLNGYQEMNDQANEMFNLLPMQYNWKSYWGLEPSTFSEVKILHFHGPKLGRGLDEMSTCDVDASSISKPYQHLVNQGVCCDQGRTATWSIDAIKSMRDSMEDFCDVRGHISTASTAPVIATTNMTTYAAAIPKKGIKVGTKDTPINTNTTISKRSEGKVEMSGGTTQGTSLNHTYATNSVFPTFSKLPSPTSFCHPNANNATHSKLNSYCNITNCMKHKKEDLLLLDKSTEAAAEQGSCKMLWFAAMHESKEECSESSIANSKRHSYFVDYSVALNSALRNARDTLQPVLVLGRYGMPYENSTEPKKLGRWAEAKGVKVVYSPRLSFQKDVDQGLMKKGIIEYSKRQGTFLRLDIPKMIKEHGLLDLPNVCKDHVLYTDVDVIFANDITMRDIELLSKSVGQSIASYGREYSKSAQIFNAGVMVMNVERLDYEMPKIIEYAKSLETFPNDQEMLNGYQEMNDQANEMFNLLPMQYNWKSYWGLEPSTFSEVKILHFHGPKLGRGLDEMSTCDVDAISNLPKHFLPYQPIIRQGVCCDQGRTATWSIDAIKSMRDSMEDLCEAKERKGIQSIQVATTDKNIKKAEQLQLQIKQMLSRPNFTYISPNSNGNNTDWGGVPSICSSWDQQLPDKRNEIAGVLFNNSDWMCQSGSIGNKLGLYFQARTFAALHGIQFHIYPPCSKEDQFDNLIAWLPQNVFVDKNNNNVQYDSFVTTSNVTTTLERMCKCHGPIAHQCKEGWPILSNTWHYEIRSALKNWASSSSSSLRGPLLSSSANQTTTTRTTGTTIEEGVATIHFRCGDILDTDVIARGYTLGMGFLKPSFYYKHLKGRNITAVHIVTTPLSSCSNNILQRELDCKHGQSCKRVLDALITRLSTLMNRPKDFFKIYDNESTLWSMHHIVFSNVSFCSPSTFCLFPSLGSSYAIHTASAMKFPAIQNTVPIALNGTFEYDDDGDNDFLIDVNKLPRNGTVEMIIKLMAQ
ncbi:hypothetical protein CTEN210_18141 [Chaetoceros tenuissimus]|uniref:Uncharacterized protein n=1 Tax=Chaetoceros tenuissimus TaxID=426638 RepID=A0AAD3DE08_9STRA|nr:hypothetical protein CTEN210_18141 [Chaetoceros tenuissimus]